MKLFLSLACCVLFFCFCLSACAPVGQAEEREDSDSAEAVDSAALSPAEEGGRLTLKGRRYTYTGQKEDVTVSDDTLTIQKAGTYRISGELTEGCLRVAAEADAVVRLILDGVSVTSSYGTPLRLERAACVILETAPDSVNTFTDAPRAVAEDSDSLLPIACVSASCDVILQGEGSLIIGGRQDCGLACADTVTLRGGSLTLSAPDTGLWVRDRLLQTGGSLTVTTAKRGLVAEKGDHAEGILSITGGRLTVSCREVALFAGVSITLTVPEISLNAPKWYDCEAGRLTVSPK